MVLAYLNEIVEDYETSLEQWKLFVVSKNFEKDPDQSPFRVAIRILLSSQSNKPLFFDLLCKHIEWISQGTL